MSIAVNGTQQKNREILEADQKTFLGLKNKNKKKMNMSLVTYVKY